ncbi:MAG: hypothetical protein BWY83_01863 [bacterium ADurb.Bin478]|nr:MAG: hypothetical protein BWY83_01863 [bacterium ADurb.Bin478]
MVGFQNDLVAGLREPGAAAAGDADVHQIGVVHAVQHVVGRVHLLRRGRIVAGEDEHEFARSVHTTLGVIAARHPGAVDQTGRGVVFVETDVESTRRIAFHIIGGKTDRTHVLIGISTRLVDDKGREFRLGRGGSGADTAHIAVRHGDVGIVHVRRYAELIARGKTDLDVLAACGRQAGTEEIFSPAEKSCPSLHVP